LLRLGVVASRGAGLCRRRGEPGPCRTSYSRLCAGQSRRGDHVCVGLCRNGKTGARRAATAAWRDLQGDGAAHHRAKLHRNSQPFHRAVNFLHRWNRRGEAAHRRNRHCVAVRRHGQLHRPGRQRRNVVQPSPDSRKLLRQSIRRTTSATSPRTPSARSSSAPSRRSKSRCACSRRPTWPDETTSR